MHHLPAESHINPSRYHFVFSGAICPPVDFSAPENMSSTFCYVFIKSSVVEVVEGDTCMMVELSKK